MALPTCPVDYSCQFTLVHPRVIQHSTDPWWQGTGGWLVAIAAVVAIVCLIAFIAISISDARDTKRKLESEERKQIREQQHELAMEEQRTMQAEQAKGDPEMLRLIREKF